MNAELKVNIDTSHINGMTELIQAADEFVTRCDNGEIRSKHSYSRFKAALEKLGSNQDFKVKVEPIPLTKIGQPTEFYHLDGKPAAPTMDDEIAQGFAAALKGLKFIHEGPALNVKPETMNAMYNAYVVKAIPKLEALVENRIAPKYSFAQLVDLGFTTYANCQGEAPLEQMRKAIRLNGNICGATDDVFACYEPGDSIGEQILNNLAELAICTQLIMNTFGFTSDDVQLKSRQLLGMSEVLAAPVSEVRN